MTGQLAGVGIDYEGASLLRDLNADLTYDFELQEVKAGAVLEDWTSLGRLVTGTLTLDADGNTALTEGFLPQTTAFTAVGQSLVADGGLSLDADPAQALVGRWACRGRRSSSSNSSAGCSPLRRDSFGSMRGTSAAGSTARWRGRWDWPAAWTLR